jgi:uncharacterized protein YceK
MLLTAALGLSLVGCSSIGDMATGNGGDHLGQRVFGGTRWNAGLLEGEHVITHGGVVEKIYGVFDFPLSLAMDVVFLPVTVTFAIARWGTTMDR